MMKIVIYGAESTGKTSLAKALANHFDTEWVPEYAREFLQKKYDATGNVCSFEDLIPIARGQILWEERHQKRAKNNLLFCDTNILQTYYYGKAYFKDFEHQELWNLIRSRKDEYDFYFLTYIDTPWVADDLRDRPEQREEMHLLFKNSLEENQIPYLLLQGNEEERLAAAIAKIKELRVKKATFSDLDI